MANTPLGKIKSCLHTMDMDLKVRPHNRKDIRNSIKYSNFSSAVADIFAKEGTYSKLDLKSDEDLQKFIDIKKAIRIWLDGSTAKEVYTMIELNNLIECFKRDLVPTMEKMMRAEKLSREEKADAHQLFSALERLHKLKYGEKKVIAKIDFSHIRDLT